MPNNISFRPICEEDEGFLFRLYASTREEELAQVDWGPVEKEAFLRMQFDAQHKYYQEQFAQAAFQIILADDRAIGRLYVDRRPDEIRIIDIALMPEARNGGIGTAILEDLLAEAAEAAKPVRIHVERFNPALRLYERLNFSQTGDNGVYFLMEWSPKNAGSST
jgi:ribosomal protein S18 acetylase RimI-like enzyme